VSLQHKHIGHELTKEWKFLEGKASNLQDGQHCRSTVLIHGGDNEGGWSQTLDSAEVVGAVGWVVLSGKSS
jgi:hypothetical protein